MTNSTKMLGLIMTAALWAGAASAQTPPNLEMSEDAPPELSLPSFDGIPLPAAESTPSTSGTTPAIEAAPAPTAAPQSITVPSPTENESDYTDHPGEGMDHYMPDGANLWHHSVPIESTGTWLRRGFWYAEADAVVWTRMWSRDGQLFASQDPNVNDPRFFDPRFIGQLQLPVLITNRSLYLNPENPGQDASVRTTLGNFLFRDSANRDHTVEFTAMGGGDWNQERILSSEEQFGLFVPFVVDGGNRSFDGSSFQSVDYKSNYKSFEMNYRVRQRLGHDQMVMDPNGHWHRAANAGFERDYLAGLRFFELEDRLDWRAEDIEVEGDDGTYFIRTDNDLFGLQLGGGLSYQASRWSLGAHAKGGVYVNDALGRMELNFTADDTSDSDLRLVEDELSFQGEFKLQGRFHVTPSFSLRAAYELMFVESVALAPNQANFITTFSYLNTTGDPFYHGVSFGLEGFW